MTWATSLMRRLRGRDGGTHPADDEHRRANAARDGDHHERDRPKPRHDLVDFMLKQLDDPTYIRKAVALAI